MTYNDAVLNAWLSQNEIAEFFGVTKMDGKIGDLKVVFYGAQTANHLHPAIFERRKWTTILFAAMNVKLLGCIAK